MLDIIRQQIKDEDLLSLPILIIPIKESVEETLTGLIANQIANEYQRPTLLLHLKDQEWTGSGRNI